MGRAFRDRHGGIIGLLQLPREQWRAIEVDLLDKGFTIRSLHDGTLSWRTFAAMVTHSPRDSALMRTVYGELVEWSATEHLLASAVDVLNLIAYLNSDTKKNKPPTPLRRPGIEAEKPTHQFGDASSAVPESEFWAIWNA